MIMALLQFSLPSSTGSHQQTNTTEASTGSSSQSLLKVLISLSETITLPARLKVHHRCNAATVVRQIKVLCMLFKEVYGSESPLPPSAMLCLHELSVTIRRIKLLLEDCVERSCVWQVVDSESISCQFHDLSQDMANALDILPLRLLDIPEELSEHIELIYLQLKRARPLVHPLDKRFRKALLSVVNEFERHGSCDATKVRWVLDAMQITDVNACHRETRLLQDEINAQAGTGGLAVLSTISKLIAFVRYATSTLHGSEVDEFPRTSFHYFPDEISLNRSDQMDSSIINSPDEFRCPISLELMTDPVIVATGHTYDRPSIARWLESGHSTCPKTGQKLLHVSLIPNYALRNLIKQWCAQQNVPFQHQESKKCPSVDHIEATQAALKDAKMTAAFLVGKLATGSPEIQRQVAYELRLLAKSAMHNRMCIAQAGAIPFLVQLLSSKDARTQENAVTALLNVSIYEGNKSLIMSAGALDSIVEVLRNGANMEARENAAATLFSLSVVNEYKVAIGNRPNAIPALVNLLSQGSSRGKKDAATALFNLSIFRGNKPKVVDAGAIPVLVNLLTDERAGITDDALAVLAILASSTEGQVAIRETRAIPVLVDLLRYGSTKGKENSIAVLLALCKSGGEDVIQWVLSMPTILSSLQRLASAGSHRAKRKAAALLKILDEYVT